jgi:D-serine deaminase-like pyridoxal phosphate-dependent protein
MAGMSVYDAFRSIVGGETLPAALVDLDAFDRNAARVAELAGGRPVRVATKSIRVPDLLKRVLDRGFPFKGLMTASAQEAALLASLGFDDFLIAYPTFQAPDLAALRTMHEQGKSVCLVVDSTAGLAALEAAMSGVRTPFPIVLETDVSAKLLGQQLGALRSPIRDGAALLALARETKRFPSLRLRGLMAYESFVAGVGDRNPAIVALKSWARRSAAEKRKGFAEALKREGFELELFNGAGTGSLAAASKEPWLSELTAGSGFLCPHLFDGYSGLGLEPACFFAVQAVRTPEPGVVTCALGGYVASGEPGPDRLPLPWVPPGKLRPAESAGEVQTPVRLSDGAVVQPGQPVFFRHAKGGELAEHFNEYLLVSGGKISGRAKTYRGLGKALF